MPTYQYACTVCGHQMEVVQSFSEDSLTVCPECEGRLRKVYSAVGIVFKGSGFYHTDNGSGRSAPSSGEAESGGGDKTDSADKADTSQGTEKAGAGSSDNGSTAGASGGSQPPASGTGSSSGTSGTSNGSSSGSTSTTAVAST